MAVVNRISEQEYRVRAMTDPDRNWELWDGVLVDKPLMNMKHGDVAAYLGFRLADQLDRSVYRVNVNGGRARVSPRDYYMPDVVVIPAAYQIPYEHDPEAFNAFAEPLPLVVEVWSFTTEPYDFAAKIAGYRQRGDLEIWFIHPFEQTLTAWRRQPDGSYSETYYERDIVPVASLPGVSIDLDALLVGQVTRL